MFDILEMSNPNFVCVKSHRLLTEENKGFSFFEGDPISIRRVKSQTFAIGEAASSSHTVLIIDSNLFMYNMLPCVSKARFELKLHENKDAEFNAIQEERWSAIDIVVSIPLIEAGPGSQEVFYLKGKYEKVVNLSLL